MQSYGFPYPTRDRRPQVRVAGRDLPSPQLLCSPARRLRRLSTSGAAPGRRATAPRRNASLRRACARRQGPSCILGKGSPTDEGPSSLRRARQPLPSGCGGPLAAAVGGRGGVLPVAGTRELGRPLFLGGVAWRGGESRKRRTDGQEKGGSADRGSAEEGVGGAGVRAAGGDLALAERRPRRCGAGDDRRRRVDGGSGDALYPALALATPSGKAATAPAPKRAAAGAAAAVDARGRRPGPVAALPARPPRPCRRSSEDGGGRGPRPPPLRHARKWWRVEVATAEELLQLLAACGGHALGFRWSCRRWRRSQK